MTPLNLALYSGLLSKAPKNDKPGHALQEAWSSFLSKCSDEDLKRLEESNIDLSNPTSENLPQFHRLFEQTENEDGECYFDSLQSGKNQPKVTDDRDPVMDFAVSIASKVIAAFDCPNSPEVNLHADCMRLAIGIASVGSQKEVAKRHGRSKQFVHWKVKSIQKRLAIGKSCFNRHFR